MTFDCKFVAQIKFHILCNYLALLFTLMYMWPESTDPDQRLQSGSTRYPGFPHHTVNRAM